MFTDILGNEVKVGDAVVICTAANYSAFSVVGVVEKFTPKKFVLKHKHKATDWRSPDRREYWKADYTYYDQDSNRVVVVNKIPYEIENIGFDPFDFFDCE